MPRFEEHPIPIREPLSGCAVAGLTLYTWGARLLRTELPHGTPDVLARFAYPPQACGVLFDVNGDGVYDLVLNETGPDRALVWLEAPHWRRHVIDTGIDAPDMIAATLFGRRGILLIQRRIQVRFYQIPPDPAGRWPCRDLYSIYTPSHQGGLMLGDVDGDGLTDIYCGNYWIRSPRAFDLPWRLFAINLWTEQENSGMVRMVRAPELVVAQRERDDARLAWFEKPADPTLLWSEHRIGLRVVQPNSLDAADFQGAGRQELLLAENGGEGRILIVRNEGAVRFAPQDIKRGAPVIHARALDVNGDGRPDILSVTGRSAAWFENRP